MMKVEICARVRLYDEGEIFMEHNYKLIDFKAENIEKDTTITYINEKTVYINFCDISILPACIIQKIETMINKMILEHEIETQTIIVLDSTLLDLYLAVDTYDRNLKLNILLTPEGFDAISATEIISPADKDYSAFKGCFLIGLKNYFHEQFERIQGCIA